jgi:hypothetical protein
MSKRKRPLLVFGCLAAALLAGYVALWLTAPRHRISPDNILLIQRGMSEKQVEGVFGVPAGVYASGASGLYVPATYFNHMGWVDRSAWGKEWVGEEISCSITFNEGKVDEVYWAFTISIENESFLAKLRRWLGIQ